MRRLAVLGLIGAALCVSGWPSWAVEPDAAAPAEPQSPFTAEQQAHWAFQPIRRPAVPVVKDQAVVRTPIDAFLLDPLEKRGLTFTAAATKRELLRRAKFDLLGLPPTPDEIEAFLADDAPDAYERLIDRLLASPQYGETWGRHWLDLVRFAETAGFNADPTRPLAYKYRDYVIRAFNDDRPYDRFVQEQLAGDELFPDDAQALVATGYNRLWPDESNASNVLLARQDALNDLTANVGSVFLGLTIGCAQCHDHKFDPILQADFYRLQAFFVGIVPTEKAPVAPPEMLAAYNQRLERWMRDTHDVRERLHIIQSTAKAKAGHEKRLKFPAEVLAAIDTAPEERTALQRQLAFFAERQIEVNEKQMLGEMPEEMKQERAELSTQLSDSLKKRPRPPREAEAMAVAEVASGPPETFVLAGGSYDYPFDEVQPGFLTVVEPPERRDPVIVASRTGTSGRRAALARWMIEPGNPLVARVIVNRVWQEHFGQGLVSNANDFGTQTPPPSHPELLDWLASEFVGQRSAGTEPGRIGPNADSDNPQSADRNPQSWSLKSLHRLIMLSSAYRQATDRRISGDADLAGAEVDPDNTLYWHFPRKRLTAERIRDSLLAVSGELNPAMYGPGVRPELPPNYTSREAWKVSEDEADRNRRSVYIFAKRNLPYPMLQAFDLPDMHESCARRSTVTVAPQALLLLNGELLLESARRFAARVERDAATSDLAQLVPAAWRLALGREPDERETEFALAFIDRQRSVIDFEPAFGEAAEAESPPDVSRARATRAAFVDFCHALLNANEFLYVD